MEAAARESKAHKEMEASAQSHTQREEDSSSSMGTGRDGKEMADQHSKRRGSRRKHGQTSTVLKHQPSTSSSSSSSEDDDDDLRCNGSAYKSLKSGGKKGRRRGGTDGWAYPNLQMQMMQLGCYPEETACNNPCNNPCNSLAIQRQQLPPCGMYPEAPGSHQTPHDGNILSSALYRQQQQQQLCGQACGPGLGLPLFIAPGLHGCMHQPSSDSQPHYTAGSTHILPQAICAPATAQLPPGPWALQGYAPGCDQLHMAPHHGCAPSALPTTWVPAAQGPQQLSAQHPSTAHPPPFPGPHLAPNPLQLDSSRAREEVEGPQMPSLIATWPLWAAGQQSGPQPQQQQQQQQQQAPICFDSQQPLQPPAQHSQQQHYYPSLQQQQQQQQQQPAGSAPAWASWAPVQQQEGLPGAGAWQQQPSHPAPPHAVPRGPRELQHGAQEECQPPSPHPSHLGPPPTQQQPSAAKQGIPQATTQQVGMGNRSAAQEPVPGPTGQYWSSSWHALPSSAATATGAGPAAAAPPAPGVAPPDAYAALVRLLEVKDQMIWHLLEERDELARRLLVVWEVAGPGSRVGSHGS